jgi:hypothetical protein
LAALRWAVPTRRLSLLAGNPVIHLAHSSAGLSDARVEVVEKWGWWVDWLAGEANGSRLDEYRLSSIGAPVRSAPRVRYTKRQTDDAPI